MTDPLIERLAALALDLVMDPPSGDDPVVRFATPTDLVAAFEDSVGLAIGDDAPAHDPDDVVAAARIVVDHSVRTNHPRFMNQNFAGADPVPVAGHWLAAALNPAPTTYDLAPAFHIELGRALAPLRDEGVLILGSGFSYHNLGSMMGGKDGPKGDETFDTWLTETLTDRKSTRLNSSHVVIHYAVFCLKK